MSWNGFVGDQCGPGGGGSGVTGSGSRIGDIVLAHRAEASITSSRVPAHIEFWVI